MTYHKTVSDEAKNILDEIIAHENEPDYWKLRFEIVSPKDDTILRGCFRELNEAKLVKTKWADNYPYYNQVLKDRDVIDIVMWRFIQRLGDIRNLCDHNKEEEPTQAAVAELIDGTDRVIKTIF